jgi:hypothetical protein
MGPRKQAEASSVAGSSFQGLGLQLSGQVANSLAKIRAGQATPAVHRDLMTGPEFKFCWFFAKPALPAGPNPASHLASKFLLICLR